jgi:hypothetical protein
MRRILFVALCVLVLVGGLAGSSMGRDRPFGAAQQYLQRKLAPAPEELDVGGPFSGQHGGTLSKQQIIDFRCESSGDPSVSVDISCNDDDPDFGQDWAPDNELAIAVNPEDPDHLLAGSNDYYYSFNNSTGARKAIVPTGFFTSFDGGATWVDGQIPLSFGNGAGDPAPAFQGRDDLALMAQLENTGGQGGCCVSNGSVTVSRSLDGGLTWERPVTVFKGKGAGIGNANNAVFWDKEYIDVNNSEGTPGYGRIVVTATKFVNGLHGSYESSAIWLSYSDDGGVTWSKPAEISGVNEEFCTFQTEGADDGTCDEDQDSYPEFAANGDLYVRFHNFQHSEAWEVEFDFDSQLMVVKADATDDAPEFGAPIQIADVEDGGSDIPFTVIGRQSPWGHQIRWNSESNISMNPNDPNDVAVMWSDRGDPNPNATEGCFFDFFIPPTYDPCDSGPGSVVSIYMSRSTDGGATWSDRALVGNPDGVHQWFPWIDHLPDGRIVAAWDQDTEPPVGDPIPANDTFAHVLWIEGDGIEPLLPNVAEGRTPDENIDVSVTHWTGQYVPMSFWPTVCGPEGYTDPPIVDAAGKDCNVFHGDYTGLAVGSDGGINVVWTGLNRLETTPQLDFYTGDFHDGYAQDAMFARRYAP